MTNTEWKQRIISRILFVVLCPALVFSIFYFEITRYDDYFRDEINQVARDYKSGKYGDEVYYFAGDGDLSDVEDVAIYKDSDGAKIVIYSDRNRVLTRRLSDYELEVFEAFITENKIDKLDGLPYKLVFLGDHWQYQYMHFTNKKMVTFFIGEPAHIYGTLRQAFWDLTEGDFDVYYEVAKTAQYRSTHKKR